MCSVTKIALTGGPCGGKTTSISILEQQLTNKGYKVFVVEEMATNVINSGASPMTIGNNAFQKILAKTQLSRNEAYVEMAENYSKEHNQDVVIIFDRGIPDSKGFMSDEEYNSLLRELNIDSIKVLDFYDGVFHLVTAADGAEEFYTCENNSARTETPEQARERDRGCMRAWTGHPHLRVITNNCSFEKKIDNLLEEVYSLLGVPVPVEIERKYLIEMPNMSELTKKYDCTTVDIIQTYLVKKEDGVERRIRQRGVNGSYTFYYTEKQKIDSISRTEVERKISEKEYLRLMTEADTTLHQIRKNRTCFVCNGTYFELDVYPFWSDRAILEVELTEESKTVKLPEEIKLIKEVTEDDRYKNSSLAKYTDIEQVETVSKFNRDQRCEVFSKTFGVCARCGKKLNIRDFTVDHYIPISKGGGNQMINLIPLCEECNVAKDNIIMEPSIAYPYLGEMYLKQLEVLYKKQRKIKNRT